MLIICCLFVFLQVLDPKQRLGANDPPGEGYPSIRAHPFFQGIDFKNLSTTNPPPIYPYLPGTSQHEELRSHYRVSNSWKGSCKQLCLKDCNDVVYTTVILQHGFVFL